MAPSPVIALLDVDYRSDHALAAGGLLRDWGDELPVRDLTARVTDVAPYEPGSFYKRELPCLLAVLGTVNDPLACVVVDGYVWLDANSRAGLGAHLYRALGESTPVVGVAKTRFGDGTFAVEALRGASLRPLYVTSAGIDVNLAADHVRAMHGPYRIPTALARVDALCRKG